MLQNAKKFKKPEIIKEIALMKIMANKYTQKQLGAQNNIEFNSNFMRMNRIF